MAFGLHRPVVVALLERETADQGADGAAVGVEGDQCTLCPRHLAELEGAIVQALQAHQVTDLGDIGGRLRGAALGVAVDERARPFHGVPGHMHLLAVTGQHCKAGFFDPGDDAGLQPAQGALLAQFLAPGSLGAPREAGFRAAVAVALVIIGQAIEDGLVGHFLHVTGHGGGNAEAFGVSVAAVAANHFRASHFRDVRCIHLGRRHVVAGVEWLVQGGLVAGLVNLVQLVHAAQDPVAALFGAHRVGQWVEARGRLGQAGDHRHLCQAHVTDRLAVVDLGRGVDTVGAVAEVDLVHVQLKNLVLGQLPLDLQGQQNFVGLAREAALAGQEEVLGHLHGDGAAAGLNVPGFHQLGGRAHQAAGVHAVVVEEIVVLG